MPQMNLADLKQFVESLSQESLFAIAGLIGAIVGSFANVCIVRMPLGKSIVWPPSHCPTCGHRLSWWENIPVLSFAILRARCHVCKNPISWRYPIVELLCIGLSLLTWWFFGDPLRYFVSFGLLIVPLVIVSFIDLTYYIIPDSISLPGIIVGAAVHQFFGGHGGGDALFDSLAGIVTGGGVLFVVATLYEKMRHREGLGGGDVKLMAMLGAFFGWQAALVILLMSSILGSVVGILMVIIMRRGMKQVIPYGPFISMAGMLYLFFGDRLIREFVKIFSI
jgi:leader peptidase (prepilin peptidase) / N-methyltransferase